MADFVTPDGITEKGKELINNKLNGKFSPEDIKSIIDLVDRESRGALLARSGGTVVADAFKRALPLIDSTSEKMSTEYAKLFKTDIPKELDDMKVLIAQIAQKKY